MVGTVLAGRYRIDSLIGSGGMANVYKAYDERDGMVVAIKMLKDEHKEDLEFQRRFVGEAKAVLTLSHPNIVKSYDVGIGENGLNYIVLEYVEGPTLKEYIKEKGFISVKETADMITKLLDALQHAHEAGIIHRDIKPQNVIVTPDGDVKLTDFGIARDTSSATRTFAGTNVIGSVHYISPEQAKGDEVTAESDIYSAAVMMYEMLTGTVPFSGETTVAIALKHLQEEMIPPVEVNSKISRAMSDVVMKGAAKEPELRYHSASDMKKDVIRALHEPRGRFARVNTTKQADPKPSKRHIDRRMVMVSFGVIFLFMTFSAVFLLSGIFEGREKEGELLIPALTGKSLNEARNLAELRGFKLSVSDYVISGEFPSGQVSKQSPIEGAKAMEGTTISVEVSSGSGYAIVPELSGKTVQEASLLLAEENLNIGNVKYEPGSDKPEGQIVAQEPVASSKLAEYDAVDIWVSGSETNQAEMPSLCGFDLDTAVDMLTQSGFNRIWIRISEPAEGEDNDLVVQQSPAANMNVAKCSPVEVWVHRKGMDKYTADIAVNIDIPENDSGVAVTAVMDNEAQAVLYENVMQAGPQQPVVFTGSFISRGERECIVYVNGTEVKRVNVKFALR